MRVLDTLTAEFGGVSGAFFANAFPGFLKRSKVLGSAGVGVNSPFEACCQHLFTECLDTLKPRTVIGLGMRVALFLAWMTNDPRLAGWRGCSSFRDLDASPVGPVVMDVQLGHGDATTILAMTHTSIASNVRYRRYRDLEGRDACHAILADPLGD